MNILLYIIILSLWFQYSNLLFKYIIGELENPKKAIPFYYLYTFILYIRNFLLTI